MKIVYSNIFQGIILFTTFLDKKQQKFSFLENGIKINLLHFAGSDFECRS